MLFILTINYSENSKNHVGEWKSEIRGYQTFDLVFKDSENLIYTAGLEVVGGKTYTIGGDKPEVRPKSFEKTTNANSVI